MNTKGRNSRSQVPSPEPHGLVNRGPSPQPEPAAKPHPASQPTPAPPQPGSPIPIPETPEPPSPSPSPEPFPEDADSIDYLPYSNSAALMTEIDRRLTALEKSDDLIKITKLLQYADQMVHEEDENARIWAFKDRLYDIYKIQEYKCFEKYIKEISDDSEDFKFAWEELKPSHLDQNSTSSIEYQLAQLKCIEDEVLEGCKFEERKIREITQLLKDLEAQESENVRYSKWSFDDIRRKIKERDFNIKIEVEAEERWRIIGRLEHLEQTSDADLSELEDLEKALDQVELYDGEFGWVKIGTPVLRAKIAKLKDRRLQREIGLEAFSRVQAERRREREREIAAKVAAGELPHEASTCGCCPETNGEEGSLAMIQGI